MSTRKTLVRSEAGVRLERIEQLSARGKQQSQFRLSGRRLRSPRWIENEREALDAFDLEVIATLSDPALQRLEADGSEAEPLSGGPG